MIHNTRMTFTYPFSHTIPYHSYTSPFISPITQPSRPPPSISTTTLQISSQYTQHLPLSPNSTTMTAPTPTTPTHNPNDDKTFHAFQNYWPWATIPLFLILLSSGVLIKLLADKVSAWSERRRLKKSLKTVPAKDGGTVATTATRKGAVQPTALSGPALLPAPVVAAKRG